jgi:hypothetical protein
VHVRDPRLHNGPLAALADLALDLGLRLLVDLFDPDRLDPTVTDQLLERQPGHLAPDRVEAAEHHRFRRVVDDQVRSRRGLEGADVATLTADDAALHVLVRKSDRRDGGLGRELGGNPLHRDRDDLAGPPVGFLAGL